MKKPVIIAIVIALIIFLLVGAVGVGLFVIYNKEKTPITSESFKSMMEEKGYIVQSVKNQFEGYDYVEKANVALKDEYQIEFYELSNVDTAVGFFNNNKTIFEQSVGTVSSSASVNLKNSSKYTQTANGQFKLISRIDNTVIYANVSDSYKDEVNSLVEELGY